MSKSEIANTTDLTVRVDGKALAIKLATMVAATAATMTAVHVVQKLIEKKA